MFWKQTRPEYERGKGAANRDAMRRQVRAGVVPGILAYDAEGPVGWCAVEPRAAFARLARSRTLAPVDDAPVWSVPCFFVARRARGTGLTAALLAAAAAHARRSGARSWRATRWSRAGRPPMPGSTPGSPPPSSAPVSRRWRDAPAPGR